ncbi:MAG: hypothetical protein WC663_03045 [Patescibacteria group bacterium]|jgi:hypothetical protein
MFIILGYDGLEYDFVEKNNFPNLKQQSHGMTDLSEFKEPRTIVIWSSFMVGKNLEADILKQGAKMWGSKIKPEDTFLKNFKSHYTIDVPGFSYVLKQHETERDLLKGFFDKKNGIKEFDKCAFDHHKFVKEQFFKELKTNKDLVFGYFNLADVVGHLSFGQELKMKLIYQELNDIAKKVQTEHPDATILIISDHGMQAIGQFGDHSRHGFWSLNKQISLNNPKPTDFANLISQNFQI